MFSRAESDKAAAQLACLRAITAGTNNVTWATINDMTNNVADVFTHGEHCCVFFCWILKRYALFLLLQFVELFVSS